MSDLKDPIKLPIDWLKVLKNSAFISLGLFALGLLLKARAIIILADLAILGTLTVAVVVGIVAAIKVYSAPKQ